MEKKNGKLSEKAELLVESGEKSERKRSFKTSTLSESEIERLIDELENQNETLRLANKRAEETVRKFSALFDLAPTACFILSKDGVIYELNLGGAGMLGVERDRIVNADFTQWIAQNQHQDFKNILKLAVETGEKQICELQLVKALSHKIFIHLECIYLIDDNKFLVSAVDISRQKQSEELARKQFLTLKGINESLSSPVFSVDTDFCYTSFNKAYFSMMKTLYGAEIEMGKSLLDYITVDENRNIAKKNLERTFRGEYHNGESNIGDTQIARKYYEILYSPTIDDSGNVIGATVVAMDISKRKLAELALKHSEQQYRYVFSEMLEGFALHEIILDDKGKPVDYRFLDINPAFERLTGLKKEETVGKTLLEILPNTETYWIKRYGRVALTGKSITFDNYSAILDHHYHVVAFRTQPGQFAVLFNDITEQKRTETALRISEEKFNKAFQNSPNAILITSLATGEIVDVNDSMFRIAGYTKAELIGKSTLELNLWDNLHEREAFRSKLKKSVRVLNFEANFRKKSGELFTGLISGEFIELQGSKCVLSVVHDISERKKIEYDLLASEEKWRSLVNTIPDFVALYDQDDDYIFLNHFAEGFTQKDIQGKHYSSFLTKESIPIYKHAFDKARKTRATQSIEYTGLGEHNTVKVYESDVVPIFEGDKYVNMMVVARDITERKIADDELRKAKEYLENLINYAHAPIIVWDDQFRIKQFNKAFEQLSGRTASGVLGKRVELLFPVATHDRSLEYIKQASAGQRWEVVEIEIQHTGGSIHTLLWNSAAIFSPDGKSVIATIAQGQDITERKVAENALLESEARLLELNATKDKFFSIIAHDLKSPFNNIVVLSNLLVEQIRNNENEGIEEYAGLIQTSSQQAMSLLVNLLDWSRTQNGRLVCSPEYVDIVSLIYEVLELLNETARQKSISVEVELPRNLLAYADEAMISTVIRNLVSNALKFTNPGGQVVVKAKRNQSDISVTVSDNGVGIKPDDIKKLFRIEESISTKGTSNEKGTGLGLILCREFVEKHGGAIQVRSEPGQGSSFNFTIPKFSTSSK